MVRTYLRGILSFAAIAAALAAALLSPLGDWLTLDGLKASHAALAAAVEARPLLALTAFFLLAAAATSLCFPAAPLIGLAGGALFGFWPGLATVLAASALGSTVAFLVSRYLLRDWVKTRLAAQLAAVDGALERHGAAALLALRFNPFIPYWLVNLAMGPTAMRARTYVPLTAIGLVPATFLYAGAGTKLAALDGAADIVSTPAIAALLLLSLLPLAVAGLAAGRRAAASAGSPA